MISKIVAILTVVILAVAIIYKAQYKPKIETAPTATEQTTP